MKAYSGVECSCIRSLLWHVDGSSQCHAPAAFSHYNKINSTKSPASDAGNVSKPRENVLSCVQSERCRSAYVITAVTWQVGGWVLKVCETGAEGCHAKWQETLWMKSCYTYWKCMSPRAGRTFWRRDKFVAVPEIQSKFHLRPSCKVISVLPGLTRLCATLPFQVSELLSPRVKLLITFSVTRWPVRWVQALSAGVSPPRHGLILNIRPFHVGLMWINHTRTRFSSTSGFLCQYHFVIRVS